MEGEATQEKLKGYYQFEVCTLKIVEGSEGWSLFIGFSRKGDCTKWYILRSKKMFEKKHELLSFHNVIVHTIGQNQHSKINRKFYSKISKEAPNINHPE